MQDKITFFLLNLAIAIDQLFNALFLGYADETLSSRAWRLYLKGNTLPCKIINKIFFWQDNHCYEAYLSEQERNHLPAEFRD